MEYEWHEHNAFGSPGLLAAAGAVIAAWNYCEGIIHSLMAGMIHPGAVGTVAFQQTHNSARLEILRYASQAYGEEAQDLIADFVARCSICIENRNLVAHAFYLPDWENPGFRVLRKARSADPMTMNTFPIDEEKMLEIADGCFQTGQFGIAVMHWLACRLDPQINALKSGGLGGPPPLPTKLPRPRKLNPRNPSDPNIAPAQHRSSPE